MIRVADCIINKLVENGISHAFMITGRGILFITDAVAKNEDIEAVSVHHEQSAAFAAYAYAQEKGTCGLCLVSTGVGATNAITGVLNAWQDDVPVVFISGQNMLNETTYYTGLNIRTYGEQEANIIEIIRPITKYAVMLENPADVIFEMEKAIHLATTGRKGPVWIDVPLDIQNARVEETELRHFDASIEIHNLLPTEEDLIFVSDKLRNSERPVVLIGSGVRSAGAVDVLRRMVEENDLPVVFDSAACDVYPDENILSVGAFGSMGGSRVGNFALQNSDLVLSIGCRLTSMQVGDDPNKFAREANIIVVDIDENEQKKKTVNIDRFIHSDAKEFIKQVSPHIAKKSRKIWINTITRWKELFPKCESWSTESNSIDLYYLAECIGKDIHPGETITCDAGIEELVIPSVSCKKNGVRCVHPASQGCMGFALGSSIGAYYATGESVISVIGDGSIMMNLQELQTIAYRKLPIKIFVANNNCYSVIRKRQQDLFRTRTIGTDYSNGVNCVDFKRISEGFGICYETVSKMQEVPSMVKCILEKEGPVLCEVITKEDQEYLRNSIAKTEKRKIVRRYLEDQAPFIDREVFYKEMIVKPLEE